MFFSNRSGQGQSPIHDGEMPSLLHTTTDVAPEGEISFSNDPSALDMKKIDSDLHDSELTSPTDTGSVSTDDEHGGWLGGIGADIKILANSIRQTAFPAIGGIANLIHRSALSVAAEIAQLERDGANAWNESLSDQPLRLPWEIPTEGTTEGSTLEFKKDQDLMVKILNLSREESTFLQPFTTKKTMVSATPSSFDSADFTLDETRIHLIRRLLELDENLAIMHARLSGRSDVRETIFWRNYFFHCDEVHRLHLAAENHLSRSLGSLIASDSNSNLDEDDSSYVCVRAGAGSPPTSLNSLTETASVGDLVLVDRA